MKFNNDNTIILFDLHDVIFTFDVKKVVKILWNTKQKWNIFTTIFHLEFLWQLLKMLWHDATDEEFYTIFEKRRPQLLPLIIEITNAQKIIPGMDKLIENLSQRGYELHVGSNIGPSRFKQLSVDFPQIMHHFKKAKIVQPQTNPLIRKPSEQYFIEYLKEHNGQNKQVVFIDDQKRNVDAANALGITAIVCKSPAQLQKQLKELGII